MRSRVIDQLSSGLFYVAAFLAVAAAVLAGLSVATASSAIPAATIGFQSPLFKPFWDMIVSSFRVAGGLIVASGLLGATLLVAFGLLLGRIRALTARVAQLEQAMLGETTLLPAGETTSVIVDTSAAQA